MYIPNVPKYYFHFLPVVRRFCMLCPQCHFGISLRLMIRNRFLDLKLILYISVQDKIETSNQLKTVDAQEKSSVTIDDILISQYFKG